MELLYCLTEVISTRLHQYNSYAFTFLMFPFYLAFYWCLEGGGYAMDTN